MEEKNLSSSNLIIWFHLFKKFLLRVQNNLYINTTEPCEEESESVEPGSEMTFVRREKPMAAN